jgi:hypothetical protein
VVEAEKLHRVYQWIDWIGSVVSRLAAAKKSQPVHVGKDHRWAALAERRCIVSDILVATHMASDEDSL